MDHVDKKWMALVLGCCIIIYIYLARESDFGTVFECPPAIPGWVECWDQAPHVGEVLAKQAIKLSVPYQLHSEIYKWHLVKHLLTFKLHV